jgi:hypothetical protein
VVGADLGHVVVAGLDRFQNTSCGLGVLKEREAPDWVASGRLVAWFWKDLERYDTSKSKPTPQSAPMVQ